MLRSSYVVYKIGPQWTMNRSLDGSTAWQDLGTLTAARARVLNLKLEVAVKIGWTMGGRRPYPATFATYDLCSQFVIRAILQLVWGISRDFWLRGSNLEVHETTFSPLGYLCTNHSNREVPNVDELCHWICKTRWKVFWESTTPRESWLDLPAHECGQLDTRGIKQNSLKL